MELHAPVLADVDVLPGRREGHGPLEPERARVGLVERSNPNPACVAAEGAAPRRRAAARLPARRLGLAALFLPVAFALLPSAAAAQTTIVVVRTKDEAVLAADSKLSVLTEGKTGDAGLACKIHRSGDTYFAVAGLTEVPGKGYTLTRLVLDACAPHPTFSAKVAATATTLERQLTAFMRDFQAEAPGTFRDFVAVQHGVVATLGFVGLDRGVPVASVVRFPTAFAPSGVVEVRAETYTCAPCPQPAWAAVLGKDGAASRVIGRVRALETLPGFNAVNTAYWLVELEIAEEPDWVGPPVDVLRVTTRGPEWVQRKARCADGEAAPKPPATEKPKPAVPPGPPGRAS